MVPDKGNVMPSAAKFPVMAFFDTVEEQERRRLPANGAGPMLRRTAYIFKVGDDVRQDVLALQVLELLKKGFERAGIDAALYPYGTIPTGFEQGIIEVVPDCQSRTALGEVSDGGLYDIFMKEYGAPGSPAFEQARSNFIKSSAAYAVAMYLLQASADPVPRSSHAFLMYTWLHRVEQCILSSIADAPPLRRTES